MNGLDLFSGYGGGADSFRGISKTLAYCEIEPSARDILLSRMWRGSIDKAPIWDDVRTLQRHHIAEPIDLITGGWPCQDLSIAGNREGLDGQRSGLFFEVIRLIRIFRPTFIFLENVPNVVRLGFGRVTGALAELRYDHRWGMLSAHDVGAPHLRERMWLFAADANRIRQWRIQSKRQSGLSQKIRNHRIDPKQIIADYLELGRREGLANEVSWQWGKNSICGASEWLTRNIPEPDIPRGHDGLFRWRDRYRALGNGWAKPQAKEAIIRLSGIKS